jgi:hypothetical protein
MKTEEMRRECNLSLQEYLEENWDNNECPSYEETLSTIQHNYKLLSELKEATNG